MDSEKVYHYVRVASVVVPVLFGYKGISHSIDHGWLCNSNGCVWCLLTVALLATVGLIVIAVIFAFVRVAWEEWDGF